MGLSNTSGGYRIGCTPVSNPINHLPRFIAVCFFFYCGTLLADYSKGLEAFEAGNYGIAMTEWTPIAKQGDSDAQYALGVMFFNGLGVEQDYEAARK